MKIIFALIYIIFLTSCTSVSITDRKQLMILGDDVIYPEAFKAYKNFKNKTKLIESGKEIDQINKVTSNLKTAIKNYYKSKGQKDPTSNFAWEVVLVDNKEVKNAWCMPGGKIAVYTGLLKVTKNTDALIKDLWEFYQGDSYYKDKTTFIITTDHGRGTNPIDSWKSHGKEVTGSDETWLIIFGKGVKARGEVANNQIYNNQIAPLIRKIMNLPQKFGSDYGQPISLE